MKRRIRLAVAALLVVVCGGLAWRFSHAHGPPDPIFSGKALSQWFYESPPGSAYLTPGALEAVRQLGSSATPYLLQEAAAQDSTFKQVLVQGLQHVPHLRFVSMYARQYRARQGLAALGPLGALVVTQGLTNADPQIRRGCALALAFPEFSAYSTGSIPSLEDALKDRNPQVRAQAAATMSTLITNAVVAVPLFAKLLNDPDRWVQVTAADGLGRYGAQAKPGLSSLTEAFSTADPLVRTHIADALKAIDPAAAAKAGAK